MSKILIVYSSVHGQTRKICAYLEDKLKAVGNCVTAVNIADKVDLGEFDKIIIGASIRHGKHNPAVYDFIEAHQAELEQKPSSFFSVSLVARKPLKNTAETNPYMRAFFEKSPWVPDIAEVFGGNLNYPSYGAMDRNIIRFIMWITKGPTAADTNIEYTDWNKVDAYIDSIHQLVVTA
ncbi:MULTISPECIES: menaquinone-dependent protoporphyrinogen IX dehydrogenase [unclassified Shewanella]|uniref:menaquinone-dependent protoporphyrinogen IX dehydrogenase n=1 Tax=unclassified Shewanella TaxID=196818 RepID=UPI001BC14AB3|nr:MULTISPECIES: menaquinone-dependent protoporphyrinogen IX dehydrogenase [unclassified Shewanella]GIU05788.1 oxygen-independent protoporphyrinogen oxidase HemG [Shewanella sp. MBTL60-112-B1]GIU25814.1 oxygen-independent protoporphyrinogen oxidase HemG [Shewanella sp. MBTL60-112-B2]